MLSSPVFAGYAQGIKPSADLGVVDWACQHVPLKDGKTPFFDIDITPWAREPMQDMADNPAVEQVCLLEPTGGGKSVKFEAVFCYWVAESPGSVQCAHPTDHASVRWIKTRVKPTMEGCEPCKPVMAKTHTHDKKKDEWHLANGMTFFFGGAGENRTQDNSVPRVLAQEAWQLEARAIEDLKARTHDRWNAIVILAGQGGDAGCAYQSEVEQCEMKEWQFKCPECGKRTPWLNRGEDPRKDFREVLKWDEEAASGEMPDWGAVYSSVRYKAPCCGAEFEDTPINRKALTMSGEYVSHGNNHVPGWVCYTYSALSIPWVPWHRLVKQFVIARQEEIDGDPGKMRAFVQKRLARFWELPTDTPEIDTEAHRYKRLDYWPTEKRQITENGQTREEFVPILWEDETHRFMAIDVQLDHFWVVIRAMKINGDSILLYEGKIQDIDTVRDYQIRFGVQNRHTAIDYGYAQDRVAEYQLRFAGKDAKGQPLRDRRGFLVDCWLLCKGGKGDGYKHPGGERKAYSEYVTQRHTEQRWKYRFTNFSNLLCKDSLAAAIRAEGRVFGVFADHSKDYGKHMACESRIEKAPGNWIWEKPNRHSRNDLWDCETMIRLLACVFGVIRIERDEDSETKRR